MQARVRLLSAIGYLTYVYICIMCVHFYIYIYIYIYIYMCIVQSAGAVEYTDCTSAEG